MSLADGFNTALGAFLTIRDENRKSKLHDLQVEAYNQQSFGRFLDNHYKSESMDDRLRYDEERANDMTAAARIRELTLDFEREVYGDRVKEVEYTTQLRGQQVATEAQRTRSTAATASRNESLARVQTANEDREIRANAATYDATILEQGNKRIHGIIAPHAEASNTQGDLFRNPEALVAANAYAEANYGHELPEGSKFLTLTEHFGEDGTPNSFDEMYAVYEDKDGELGAIKIPTATVYANVIGDEWRDVYARHQDAARVAGELTQDAQAQEAAAAESMDTARRSAASLGDISERVQTANAQLEVLNKEREKIEARLSELDSSGAGRGVLNVISGVPGADVRDGSTDRRTLRGELAKIDEAMELIVGGAVDEGVDPEYLGDGGMDRYTSSLRQTGETLAQSNQQGASAAPRAVARWGEYNSRLSALGDTSAAREHSGVSQDVSPTEVRAAYDEFKAEMIDENLIEQLLTRSSKGEEFVSTRDIGTFKIDVDAGLEKHRDQIDSYIAQGRTGELGVAVKRSMQLAASENVPFSTMLEANLAEDHAPGQIDMLRYITDPETFRNYDKLTAEERASTTSWALREYQRLVLGNGLNPNRAKELVTQQLADMRGR